MGDGGLQGRRKKLRRAIMAGCAIRFHYTKESGEGSRRLVKPVRLRGSYLYAYDQTPGKEQALKTFLPERMEDVRLLGALPAARVSARGGKDVATTADHSASLIVGCVLFALVVLVGLGILWLLAG